MSGNLSSGNVFNSIFQGGSSFLPSSSSASSSVIIMGLKELWSRRPTDSEPLKVISWYLESKTTEGLVLTSNIVVRLPRAEFNLHQFDQIVALTMVQFGANSYESHCELRWTIIRHVVAEMIKLKRWYGLVIYRVNQELTDPNVDRIYQQFILPELEKLQPNIKPAYDPNQKTTQILFSKQLF